jgi:hypothetical protein
VSDRGSVKEENAMRVHYTQLLEGVILGHPTVVSEISLDQT